MLGGRCGILVIEDDRETTEQIVEFLAASGYEVDLAVDGDEGLSRARSADYAVMTIDRMLPGIDGIAVIRRLREEGTPTTASPETSVRCSRCIGPSSAIGVKCCAVAVGPDAT